MAIADSDYCVYLIDMNDGFETLIRASTPSQCVKLTPDCRFLFGLFLDRDDFTLFCLDIDGNTKLKYSLDPIFRTRSYQYASQFETCNERGFLSGDPFWCSFGRNIRNPSFMDFALVLKEDMLLRVSPRSKVIEMCRLNDVREWRGESSDEAGQSTELGYITTKRAENNDLAEHNLPEIKDMLEQNAEIDVLSGYRAEVVDPSEQRAELKDSPEQMAEFGALEERTMELNNSTEKKGELDDLVGERTEFNDLPEKNGDFFFLIGGGY